MAASAAKVPPPSEAIGVRGKMAASIQDVPPRSGRPALEEAPFLVVGASSGDDSAGGSGRPIRSARLDFQIRISNPPLRIGRFEPPPARALFQKPPSRATVRRRATVRLRAAVRRRAARRNGVASAAASDGVAVPVSPCPPGGDVEPPKRRLDVAARSPPPSVVRPLVPGPRSVRRACAGRVLGGGNVGGPLSSRRSPAVRDPPPGLRVRRDEDPSPVVPGAGSGGGSRRGGSPFARGVVTFGVRGIDSPSATCI